MIAISILTLLITSPFLDVIAFKCSKVSDGADAGTVLVVLTYTILGLAQAVEMDHRLPDRKVFLPSKLNMRIAIRSLNPVYCNSS